MIFDNSRDKVEVNMGSTMDACRCFTTLSSSICLDKAVRQARHEALCASRMAQPAGIPHLHQLMPDSHCLYSHCAMFINGTSSSQRSQMQCWRHAKASA